MQTKIYVGKARSNHAVPQEGINALTGEYAVRRSTCLPFKRW